MAKLFVGKHVFATGGEYHDDNPEDWNYISVPTYQILTGSLRTKWRGEPFENASEDTFMTADWEDIHCIVELMDLAEALTSPFEYVREYRRWYEQNK